MSAQNTQNSRQIWSALLPTIIYIAILPYVIYQLASPHVSTVSALLLAAIPPGLVTVIGLIRRRRLNLFGMLALVGIAIKVISALLFRDIRLILISDSLMTGVYGIIMLLSLLLGKPILLALALSMQAGAPPERRAEIEKRWQDAGSSFFTLLTAGWGVALLLALLISVALTYILPLQQFLLINPLFQYSLFGGLILWSQVYGTLRRRRNSRLLIQHQQEIPTNSI